MLFHQIVIHKQLSIEGRASFFALVNRGEKIFLPSGSSVFLSGVFSWGLIIFLVVFLGWFVYQFVFVSQRGKQYQELTNMLPHMIFEADLKGRLIFLNRQAYRNFGYMPQDLKQGISLSKMLVIEDRERFERDLQRICDEQQSSRNEYTAMRKDGSTFFVTITLVLISCRRASRGILGVISDVTSHKQQIQALQTSRARLDAIFDNTRLGIAITDLQGHFLQVNEHWAAMLGYTVEDVYQNHLDISNVTHPDDLPTTQAYIQSLQNGEINHFEQEKRFVRKDGSVFWGELSVTAISGAQGHLKETFGFVTDITERKRAEDALRKERTLLRTLVDHLPDAVYAKDLDARKTLANPKDLWYIGAQNEADVLGKTDFDFLPKALAESSYSEDRRVLDSGEPLLNCQQAVTIHDDYERWLLISKLPLRDSTGKVIGLVGVSREITEQVEAERALQQRQAYLRSILDNIPYLAWLKDQDGRFLAVNRSLALAAGFTHPDELIGKTDTDIGPYDLAEKYRADDIRAMETGEKVFVEELININGENTWFETYKSPIFDAEGNVIGTTGLARDITERKETMESINHLNATLEQRVADRTAQLEAANKELEAFSYSVSHDLRAPLRSLDGFSLALLEEYQDLLDNTGQDYLRRIRSSSQRMARLIDDLLTLSRVTRSTMRYVKVDLSEIARSVANDLQASQPERRVTWHIADHLFVDADPNLMRVVLSNLLNNAWKFTAHHSSALIEVGQQVFDGKVVYYVRDDGAGFDMNYAEKLFGAFQRMHTASEFDGTGIGLATVQRIVHRHGGEIWAESAVEQGTTLFFTL